MQNWDVVAEHLSRQKTSEKHKMFNINDSIIIFNNPFLNYASNFYLLKLLDFKRFCFINDKETSIITHSFK